MTWMRPRWKPMLALMLAVGALWLSVTVVRAQPTPPPTTTASPPLGNVLQTIDGIIRDGATAYSVWTDDDETPHQVWFRISSASAKYRQRLRVYKEGARPRPDDMLPPLSTLVFEVAENQPTDWYQLDPEQGIYTYYFDGDHRTNWDQPWDNAEAVLISRTRHTYGEFYTIGFEDIPSLDDYNDLVVEVAFLQSDFVTAP